MILAVIGRIENIKEEEPFNYRYYITEHFKKMFDELNVLLFPIISDVNLEKICSLCDGLIVTGSANDINPKYYNDKPIENRKYEIDEFILDKKIINIFSNSRKPILGICGGLQSINVCFGGSLNQNIDNHNNKLHEINIKENSFLYNTYETKKIEVNSFHHQSINRVAEGFEVTACSDDGTIEAIERDNIIGVQWHPEEMNDLEFFNNFIKCYLM